MIVAFSRLESISTLLTLQPNGLQCRQDCLRSLGTRGLESFKRKMFQRVPLLSYGRILRHWGGPPPSTSQPPSGEGPRWPRHSRPQSRTPPKRRCTSQAPSVPREDEKTVVVRIEVGKSAESSSLDQDHCPFSCSCTRLPPRAGANAR